MCPGDWGCGRLQGFKTLPRGCEETGWCNGLVPPAETAGAGCWQARGAPQALGAGLQRWGARRGSGVVSGHASRAQLGQRWLWRGKRHAGLPGQGG